MKKVIFLTGATGIVGGAVLAQLLSEEADQEIIVLVRGKDRQEAKAKILTKLSKYSITDINFDSPYQNNYVNIINKSLAEVTKKDAKDVTHVIHLAANTSFLKVPSLYSINIEGTRNLAASFEGSKTLERFLYVGTAFICGNSEKKIVEENGYPNESAIHLVEYTKTKAIAETMLRNEFNLPLVVARPSIIVGDSDFGVKITASIYWVFQLMHELAKITFPIENKIDIVSGNWVAKAIVFLTMKDKLKYDSYHLSAGEENSVSFKEIEKKYNEIRKENQKYETVSELELKDFDKVSGTSKKRMKSALSLYYKFAKANIIFSNSRLLEEGIGSSIPFTDYLDKCQETCKKSIEELLNEDDV